MRRAGRFMAMLAPALLLAAEAPAPGAIDLPGERAFSDKTPALPFRVIPAALPPSR